MTQRPWEIIPQFDDHSIMIINPSEPEARIEYLISRSDYSLLVTDHDIKTRQGSDYPDERVLWYTSGTTGDSKFYGFSQTQVTQMAENICRAYDITANDRYFGIMPLWHAHGANFYWATRLAGCEVEFGSLQQRSRIERFQPTFLTTIPNMMQVLMQCKFDHLRFVRTSSGPLYDVLYHDLRERFRVPVIAAFGMTETMGHCLTNPLHGEQRVGTVGIPSGVEAMISQGQLHLKGPSVVTESWLETGDLAEQDSQGYFKILGRAVDQINVKGIKIDPISIESQMRKHFVDISEVVVFGKDKLKCIYTGKADHKIIQSWLRTLGDHCRPALLRSVAEIPRDQNGKISRTMLEKLFS